ncbi:calcium-binding protein [Shinella sp. S4-D37]|uniref:calcium-binding protein n=1 Tax=Shinella sp. S4-D37 TaxID=3161999 RepID=UPI0034654704
MASVQLYSEFTQGDTYNEDLYGGEFDRYPVFELDRDVVGRYKGSLSEYLGQDTADYFALDIAKSGLKPGDKVTVSFSSSSGTDIHVGWGDYTYTYMETFGPNFKLNFLSDEKMTGTLTIPAGADVISFQVYNHGDQGTYQVDLLHHAKLRTTLAFMGVGNRPELFRVSDATEPVKVVAGKGDDFAWTGKVADEIQMGPGRDIAVGLDGDDFIYGYGKSDISGLEANGSDAAAKDGADQLLGGRGKDKMYGGAGGDYMHGEWGNDTLYGESGSDLMYGGYGKDVMNGGSGNDRMYGGSEKKLRGDWFGEALTLTWDGTTGKTMTPQKWSIPGEVQADDKSNDRMSGGSGNDRMWGQGGNDKLFGGLGKDFLSGGSGNDSFVFDTKLGSTNVDTIDDFSVKDDTILLDRTIFTKVGKVGDLSSGAFYAGAKAHDASDRILYDKASGKLWYDADGNGGGKAVLFAILDKGLSVTVSDFDIIS